MIRIMDSHAYPGCRALAEAALREGPAHVEFSDGTVAGARIRRLQEGRIAVAIDAHRTGKGTPIAQKTWLFETQGEDRWRVVRRLEDEA